jgi:hypothetical protein
MVSTQAAVDTMQQTKIASKRRHAAKLKPLGAESGDVVWLATAMSARA